MPDKENYEQFAGRVTLSFITRPGSWRKGQFLFNELCSVRPDLAERIRASDLDPFFQDWRIEACMEFLRENW
jgi:hypothetical protein